MTAPRIVLVRPRNADNLVSIARSMRGFGLVDWVAVSSKVHLEGMREVLSKHREPSQNDALVDTLRRVDTIEEAVADCSFVVGTTMREFEGRPRLTPRELVRHVAARGDARWALVFGAETNGLQNDDLEQCHAVSFIPSSEEQPSLNLSQAVVVYGYELFCGGSAEGGASRVLADDAALRRLRLELIERMRAFEFPVSSVEELMTTLRNAALTEDEAARWMRALAREW